MDLPRRLVDLPDCQENWDYLAGLLPPKWPVLPRARLRRSGNLSVNNNTNTAVPWDVEDYDVGTITEQHSTSSNTTRLVCQFPGMYSIVGGLRWTTGNNGDRMARLFLNTTTTIGSNLWTCSSATNVTLIEAVSQYYLNVGDFVELVAYQTNGGAIAINVESNVETFLAWHWISA